MVTKDIDIYAPLTEEQKREVEELKKLPENTDEPLSQQQLEQLKAAAEERRRSNRKQTVCIRLSPQTVQKAKALGPGYTTILAEIIEQALNQPELSR